MAFYPLRRTPDLNLGNVVVSMHTTCLEYESKPITFSLFPLILKEQKKIYINCIIGDVRGYVLVLTYGTTPAAVTTNKQCKVSFFKSSENIQ